MQESGRLFVAGHFLDARGLRCPLPLLRLKQALSRMATGEELEVATTDAGSVKDFRVFLGQAGHELLQFSEAGQEFRFHVRKGG